MVKKAKREQVTEQLRRLVRECGASCYAIAKQTGVSESALSRFLSGERGLSGKALDQIGELLGFEVVMHGPNPLVATPERSALPEYPPADAEGNRPALEFARVSIARTIIEERRAAGLSQEELARRAGVRQETISRLESGKHSPTVRTVEKIERALQAATQRAGKRLGKPTGR